MGGECLRGLPYLCMGGECLRGLPYPYMGGECLRGLPYLCMGGECPWGLHCPCMGGSYTAPAWEGMPVRAALLPSLVGEGLGVGSVF